MSPGWLHEDFNRGAAGVTAEELATPSVQGAYNALPVGERDRAFVVVPGSHAEQQQQERLEALSSAGVDVAQEKHYLLLPDDQSAELLKTAAVRLLIPANCRKNVCIPVSRI